MGILDIFLNEEQRVKKEARAIEAESNLLETKLYYAKQKARRDKLRKELDDLKDEAPSEETR